MPDTAPPSQEMLCQALELADKAVGFYAKAVADCPEALGREVFERLMADKKKQRAHIEEVYRNLQAGKAWEAACRLRDDEPVGMRGVFTTLVPGMPPGSAACMTVVGALSAAIDAELAALRFFHGHLARATDSVEKAFLTEMIRDQRGFHVLLSDTRYYFEDPQGWHLEKEGSGLDGA
ncbi:hypothetical protein G3N56_16535 [Desulfovibrio sulfodismutans]|uniref:Ferritin-like domain-containing protein n=1 Tax=Desulfolutivibrio sulfodismutans TaxID=63561 RepID=A0A7K3NQ58_9BACT|nr:hypothetical protein [Desulfolutivibrio sulfodismutans]NDY58342.1 hypothetical protein [Desulfolutivibrio sulfodismutans]QLA11597.1 hypothetical protein GD606_04570 [Desulfolutivibrio sulfodismutans DSM 3696]